MEANSRKEVQSISAGDIAAIAGLKNTATGDTLCDPKNSIRFESLDFPEPVIHIAIEPKSTVDAAKLQKSLQSLKLEDPSFTVKEDEETGQTLIGGMGELHLEVMVDRLKREFRVECNVGAPQVVYREGISSSCRVEEVFDKQYASTRKFAKIVINVEANDTQTGLIFENLSKKSEIPEHLLSSVELGVKQSLLNGPIAGYPVLGVKVVVLGGEFDDDATDETSFQIVANQAMRKALQKASPILLEPLMSLEVLVPDDYLSGVMTDLSSRKAKVNSISQKGHLQLVQANVPLAQMFGYSTDLRSVSQGRATYSMQFHSYEEVSKEQMERFRH